MIQTLAIRNFKSIRHLQMECRRVNVSIGEPQYRQSPTFLEAIGLFSLPYSYVTGIRPLVRAEKMDQLFYNHETAPIWIKAASSAGTHSIVISRLPSYYTLTIRSEQLFLHSRLNESGELEDGKSFRRSKHSLPVRFYRYRNPVFRHRTETYLLPPEGENLPCILATEKLLSWGEALADFGLRLVVLSGGSYLHVQGKHENEAYIASYAIPYPQTSGTLQRVVFFIAAIESNSNAIIVLEEPEAHVLPLTQNTWRSG